ncbi:hypothetical protein KCU85_g284, partial [Aureobasidium melanogenum]
MSTAQGDNLDTFRCLDSSSAAKEVKIGAQLASISAYKVNWKSYFNSAFEKILELSSFLCEYIDAHILDTMLSEFGWIFEVMERTQKCDLIKSKHPRVETHFPHSLGAY